MYKYENRIIYILRQIIDCCGEIKDNEKVCSTCQSRITKCARLVERGQMPIFHYIQLLQSVIAEKNIDED